MRRLTKKEYNYEVLAEMLCELTRQCGIKEDFFAKSFRLSPTEVRVLKLFSFSDTFTIKDIKEKLKVSPGRVTHIIESLEKKKLLKRVRETTDRRNVKIRLMPNAQPHITNLHKNYNKLHKEILKSISAKDMKKIYFSLETLNEVFKKWI